MTPPLIFNEAELESDDSQEDITNNDSHALKVFYLIEGLLR